MSCSQDPTSNFVYFSYLLFWRTWWIRQNTLSHIFLGSCSLHPITNFELRFFLTFLIWLTCWMRQNTLSHIFLGSCSLDPITNHEFRISFLQIFYSEPSNEIIAIRWTCWMRQNMLSHILFFLTYELRLFTGSSIEFRISLF